mmetsp:Transcript_12304/g.31044  ORF Transcript_12304/g.31044 Transcript_12304/m.31044 type:complete len:205 (-) Transcript_12304:119-733(-)
MDATMSMAACFASGACVIGLPMTRKVAPSAIACAGVTTRFWSPISPPVDRIPGTMVTNALPHAARIAGSSFAEQTTPSSPHACASLARRTTCSTTGGCCPTATRSASSMLVRIVTAITSGGSAPTAKAPSRAAETAARIIASPPAACTLTMAGRAALTARIAPATVFGMSWNLRSRKKGVSGAPSRTRCTPAMPLAEKNSRPIL